MKKFFVPVLAVALFGLVGAMEVQDAKLQHAGCLQMVADGIWPESVCK